MTTRWHYQNTAPAVSHAFSAAWAVTSSAVRMAQGAGNGIGVTAGETSATPINVLGIQVTTDALAAGPIAGTFRLCVSSSNAQSSNAFLRVRVRLMADDGTERGVLVDATDATALPMGGTQTVTAFSAAITPATAVAGDRLVVEYGAFMNNTATTSRSIGWGTWNSGGADFAFVDGTTGAGKPWFEIEPPPVPDPVTGLAQSAATTTTVDVDWTLPATGTAPTGVDLRVDGGAPTAIGLVSTRHITGLSPDTAYTVEVRTTAPGGSSAWVGVVATTNELPPEPVTDLTQTAQTTDSVELEWTLPATGTAPTGVDLRVDGGAPTAIGLVSGHTVTALAPSTTYTVEVRTTAPSGASTWEAVEAVTSDPLAGDLDWVCLVTLGEHTWTVNAEDPAAYGPLAGLRVAWTARQDDGWPTQPDAYSCNFQVLTETAAELADVDLGTRVHVRFTPTEGADPLVDFGGVVRSAVASPHPLGSVLTVAAMDDRVVLAEMDPVDFTLPQHTPQQRFEMVETAGVMIGSSILPPGESYPADDDNSFGGWYPPFTGTLGVLDSVYKLVLSRNPDRILVPVLGSDGLPDPDQPWQAFQTPQTPIPVLVDAGLLHTEPTAWARDRSIPNRVKWNTAEIPTLPSDVGGPGLDVDVERAHPGIPDITRSLKAGDTAPGYVIAGTDGPSRWSTSIVVAAHLLPAKCAGWFTQPDAQRHMITVFDIDPRHNPNDPDDLTGLLAGAELVIPPGGKWLVSATLRRVLFPDSP